MTAVGIIPARYASTRFPGKVLAPIHDYPMVHHVYRRAAECSTLEEVIIATDSQLVAETCIQLGDRVMLTSSEHSSGTDRVAEAAQNLTADLVINIQGDEPKLDTSVVDELVTYMQRHGHLPMGTVGSTTITSDEVVDPNVVKVIGRDGLATGFYRTLPAPPPKGELLRHIGLYAYRRDFLFQFTAQTPSSQETEHRLEQLRALEMGASIGLITTDCVCIGVDTPKDLERVVESWDE
ncbi:MAG: 3-deoxy-manno-octulosonate cytidylyltransferase [Fidelibacterota bacterium]|nr:MAG: 3-deoxy-manno-octulosonate cytidylyltransferase [Candidatus Neomarinimicrobiota bacterium]